MTVRSKVVAVMCLVIAAVLLGVATRPAFRYGMGQDDGLVPASIPLNKAGSTRASFTAKWTEPHSVSLRFPKVEEADVRRLVEEATSLSSWVHPVLDFSWEVLDGARIVERGTGKDGHMGLRHDRDGRVIHYGPFSAQTGANYVVAITPGPGFGPYLVASPKLEIHMANERRARDIGKIAHIDRLLTLLLGLLALAFVTAGLWTIFAARRITADVTTTPNETPNP